MSQPSSPHERDRRIKSLDPELLVRAKSEGNSPDGPLRGDRNRSSSSTSVEAAQAGVQAPGKLPRVERSESFSWSFGGGGGGGGAEAGVQAPGKLPRVDRHASFVRRRRARVQRSYTVSGAAPPRPVSAGDAPAADDASGGGSVLHQLSSRGRQASAPERVDSEDEVRRVKTEPVVDLHEGEEAAPSSHEVELPARIRALERYDDSGVSPFENVTPNDTPWEWFKFVFFTVTLIAPLKMLLLFVCAVLIYLFALLSTLGLREKDRAKPRPWYRHMWVYPIRLLSRVIMFIAGFYWISVSDFSRMGSMCGPRRDFSVIVCNHVSMWDHFHIVYYWGCSGAAKSSYFGVPIIGRVLQALQCVPIDRFTPEGRKRALRELMKRSMSLDYPPILIFPEGTTSNNTVLTTWKRGAFAAGVPVLPVALQYTGKYNDCMFGQYGSEVYYVYWSLCQFYNPMRIDYLPIVNPNDEERKDANLYARNTRRIVADHLRWQVTNHQFDDVRLMIAAKRYNVSLNIYANDIRQELDLSIKEVQRLMERFNELDKDGDGLINFAEFCKTLQFDTASLTAVRLFKLFDTNDAGNIDFAEFLTAISVCTKQVTEHDSLRVLFEVADSKGDGVVDSREFAKLMSLARDAFPPDYDDSHGYMVGEYDLNEVALALFDPDVLQRIDRAVEVKVESGDEAKEEEEEEEEEPAQPHVDVAFDPEVPIESDVTLTFEEFHDALDPYPDFGRCMLYLFVMKRVGGLKTDMQTMMQAVRQQSQVVVHQPPNKGMRRKSIRAEAGLRRVKTFT